MQNSGGTALFEAQSRVLVIVTTKSWFLGIDTPQLPKNRTIYGSHVTQLYKAFPAQPARSEGEVSLFLRTSCLFLSLFQSGGWKEDEEKEFG